MKIIHEQKIDQKTKIRFFIKGKRIENTFLYVPCFNYKKEVFDYFNNCFLKRDNFLFITFECEEIHRRKLIWKLNDFTKTLLKTVRWIENNTFDSKIIILAESWACSIAVNLFKTFRNKFDRLVIWNFPSYEKYKKTLKEKEFLNTLTIKWKGKKIHIFNGKKIDSNVYFLSSPIYVKKFIKFNLIKFNKKYKSYFDSSEEMFLDSWMYLLNEKHNNVYLLESKNNVLKSENISDFANMFPESFKFIEGHHLLLMNKYQNKNLFKELENIIYA